ncbi:phosphoribosylformimino-5-aminoimidazole carboxamide ribotide isomerase [Pelagicoccus sp. SDUM812003]|uniref:phosphoribosylformimino-5-aminoimidazole carboxamide ribotide isomerase n=1 Tax=Pelagicoccus sp. SDUM812003 TaxID=3041267 RepID=UPI00280D4720|nr:phosphoribosylformimino-5-aminoimidazole carboxamide ribotide isomerase [Pelagicoccus sp. SDUM812003]MDQ8205340.1 phosphoribosylformimino-5-aminoimidazole carboxamide ribotide isomerase [Pelagicoccus sp. SDUM812003]
MRFRPCIDLKNGKVVQIVGGTLSDTDDSGLSTNFESDLRPADYAKRYQRDGLLGGHVIALGPGNQEAALEALGAYPGGLQYGGGVTLDNAAFYLDAGASQVIVTSYVFRQGRIDFERLQGLLAAIGRDRLVLDLSCRLRDGAYWVVTDRWQSFTDTKLDRQTLGELSTYCCEFLVHGVDVEGRMAGIEEPLVAMLGEECSVPVTYAGGARSMEDLERVRILGKGNVDLTIGSALDLFGGSVPYAEVVAWHKHQNQG